MTPESAPTLAQQELEASLMAFWQTVQAQAEQDLSPEALDVALDHLRELLSAPDSIVDLLRAERDGR